MKSNSAIKNTVAKKAKVAARAPAKKSAKIKDYFKLPFEVYYGDPVPITIGEFKSDIQLKKFSDIKLMEQSQGYCHGLLMECSVNNGPELYCCIKNFHNDAEPNWLTALDEQNLDINVVENFVVSIQENIIKFIELSDGDLSLEDMDYCDLSGFSAYGLDQACPDYLILDAKDSRVKVGLDGYIIGVDGKKTKDKVFNPSQLDDEIFSEFETNELWDVKYDWVKSVLESKFPKEKGLIYAPY